MGKKTVLLFFLVLVAFTSNAGRIDTAYVQRFKSLFSIKTFALNNGFYYTLTPQNNSLFTEQQLSDARVRYSANIPPVSGVSVNINGIGLTYIFKITNDYLDTAKAIKSGYKQFQLNMYGSRFGIEVGYQDFSRFYFKYKGDDALLKNYNTDIRSYQFGASAMFIKNGRRFSYNAAFNQNQFQKKSAGSAITVMGFRYNEIKSPHLIPDSIKQFYKYPDLNANKNYAFIIQHGYAYNLVKNRFFFANALFVGVGFQNQVYYYSNSEERRLGVPISARAKSSVGYNGKVFFAGLSANAEFAQSQIKILKTEQFQYTYGVFIGFRAISIVKSKAQLREEAREKKLAEKEAKREAAKRAKEEKKAARN
ncbi:MAG: DUF4421 family protein [Bacteroidia bacterium]